MRVAVVWMVACLLLFVDGCSLAVVVGCCWWWCLLLLFVLVRVACRRCLWCVAVAVIRWLLIVME